MRFKILTAAERRAIERFFKDREKDAEKTGLLRTLALRSRKYLPSLEGEVRLLRQFLAEYSK